MNRHSAQLGLNLLGERKFDIRIGGLSGWNGESSYFVWRINYNGSGRDRAVAGPFKTEASAQSAIDEGRVTCL